MQKHILFIFSVLILVSPARAAAPPDLLARQIYQKLTGLTPEIDNAAVVKMIELIKNGKRVEAAQLATAEPSFIDNVVRTWAQPFSNTKGTALTPLDDMVATIVGVTRDNIDAREILFGDFIYGVTGSTPVLGGNQSYINIDAKFGSLNASLKKYQSPYSSVKEPAGVLTTRAFAEAYYSAGTNRRAIAGTLKNFLCTEMESVMAFNLPDNWVRRDVDRKPGGSYNTYRTRCVGCHSGMDALGGAFANFDFTNSTFSPQLSIATKMNQNSFVYPDGHIVTDDSWENLWFPESKSYGRGAREYGLMLTQTNRFTECMAQRIYTDVCRRSITEKDPLSSEEKTFLVNAGRNFANGGYKLKNLFAEIASATECLGD